ncbi:MAG: DUF4410 domain-containing protein [Rhodospirillales bacterium]
MGVPQRLPVFRRGLAVALVALAAAGCAAATVTPERVRPPEAPSPTVAVGTVEAGPERWKRLVRFFRIGLVRRLRESEAFEVVLDPAPRDPPPGTIVVAGRITDVDEGSEPARLIIGLGFGRATVAGRFAVTAVGSEAEVVFEQRQASSSGNGQGAHWTPVTLEDLMETLGEETAETILRWRDGEALVRSPWQALW